MEVPTVKGIHPQRNSNPGSRRTHILQRVLLQEFPLQSPTHFSLKLKGSHQTLHDLDHQEQRGNVHIVRALTKHTTAMW